MTDPNSTAVELAEQSEALAQRLDEFDVIEVSNPDRRMIFVRILDRLRVDIDSANSTYGKRYTACSRFRPSAPFYLDRGTPDGMTARCRDCTREARRGLPREEGPADTGTPLVDLSR